MSDSKVLQVDKLRNCRFALFPHTFPLESGKAVGGQRRGEKCLCVLSNSNRKFEIFHKNVITAIPATEWKERKERRTKGGGRKSEEAEL